MGLLVVLTVPCLAAPSKPSPEHPAATKTQSTKPSAAKPAPPTAPVKLHGQTLFSVPGVLSFTAEARAEAIQRRLIDISKDVELKSKPLTVTDGQNTSDIMAGDLVVMSVTDQDAAAADTTRQVLAMDYTQRINDALEQFRQEYSLKSITLGVIYALVATALLILFFRFLSLIFRQIYVKLHSWRGTVIRSLRIQSFELLPAGRITAFAIGLAKLVRLAITLVVTYIYASAVLGFFPWTRGYARLLLKYVLSALRVAGEAIVGYLPNMFFIAVIAVIALYVIKFVRVIFAEIGKGTIEIPNFYPEWAEPTYKIVRVLILILAAVIVFPYLPGSDSGAFRGISIFLGVLLSLGSTSAVANIVAGVILTYMRAFNVGDRVKIADTVGDVMEKTLLITRIRTIKNVEITIANAMVLNSHIVNFSASAREEGLILHTEVTIGYDAPWRTVHQLLLEAAAECEHIMKEPKPFVLQTALDDFYVHYEINAHTDQPSKMAVTYSQLHQKIQDKFNEAGVEIMSPHYASVRDGNNVAVPDEYLPREYKAPRFRVGLENILGQTGNPGDGKSAHRPEE
ncbi:MAG TPA: mechanosensitive ion channel family protein [Terracidiphilus sp.]|nr:mechanosensitive ion channel family protein [Terracidiphilus sp.]